jgi:peptidoglycan hydrolase-like protein with peptidoglycan-binding domain
MADGWLPSHKYERLQVTNCTGPGTMHDSYAWAFILHTTESAPGSINGINNLFRAKPCSAPHLTIDPMGSRRRVQYIPLDWSACALKGGRSGWQTNRGRAIQMEICGRANDTPGWDDDTLYQIADVIADVIAAGYPINPHNTPDMSQLTGVLAREDAAQRYNPAYWRDFDGVSAHVYMPFNDHYDAFRLNSYRIRDLVLEILRGQGRPIPPPTGVGTPSQPQQDGMLRQGMNGGIVKMLQELIIGMGYDCGPAGPDGDFGPATDAAVRILQADHGLEIDGIAGPATMHAISQAYAWARQPIPAPGPAPAWPGRYLLLADPMLQGGDVRQWQEQMASRGWRIGVDGWYGLESLSVCKTFQDEKGLKCDGVVGPSTWNASWAAPIS